MSIPVCFGMKSIFLLLFLFSAHSVWSASDTTIVTFVDEPIDNAHRMGSGRFWFPPLSEQYRQVIMHYTIACPSWGCDPWDRVSTITVARPGGGEDPELVEISRIVTPAGKGWGWSVDVTDYRSLLHDSVTLNNYIQTYIGGGRGFLVTITFEFIAGKPLVEAYRVENVWTGLPEYGNPNNPIESLLQPVGRKADPDMDFAKIRITTTGHGEGNTEDAATYAKKRHDLVVGAKTLSHQLWRDDCDQTPAGPMLGDWERSRAGFCPGALVRAWDNDITHLIKPGGLFTVDYNVEPYENYCRPDVVPCPCSSCDYNDVTRNPPYYWIESQILYYRIVKGNSGEAFNLESDEASGIFQLIPSLSKPMDLVVRVVDILGEEVFRQVGREVTDQPMKIDLSSTPGILHP